MRRAPGKEEESTRSSEESGRGYGVRDFVDHLRSFDPEIDEDSQHAEQTGGSAPLRSDSLGQSAHTNIMPMQPQQPDRASNAVNRPPASAGEAPAAAHAQAQGESCRAKEGTIVSTARRCQPHRACKAADPQCAFDMEAETSRLLTGHYEQVRWLPRVARKGKPQGGAEQPHARHGARELATEAEPVAGVSVPVLETMGSSLVCRLQVRRACKATGASAPHRMQRSKCLRATAETAPSKPGQRAAPSHGGRENLEQLDSMGCSGAQAEVERPAKRSRRATPHGHADTNEDDSRNAEQTGATSPQCFVGPAQRARSNIGPMQPQQQHQARPCKAMDQPPASVGEAAAAADAQPKAESCRANTDTTVGVAQRCQPHRACKAAAPQRSRDKEPALSQLPAEHQEQVQRLPRVARMGKPQGGAKQTHANYGVPEITIEAEAVAGGSVQIPVTARNGPVRRRQPRRACSAIHPQPAQKGEAKPSTWPGKEAHKAPAASHKRKPDKDKESPVTRRQRMLCAGEQQRYIQAAETEPPTPAHAPQALASQGTGPAQLAQSPDAAPSQQGVSGRRRRSRYQVRPVCTICTPPSPAQQPGSAPSRTQRGKRPREATEITLPDVGKDSPTSNGGRGNSHVLKSAEHNSVQPDLAPQAARSAKRSRQATPEDCAGVRAAASAAASASATTQFGRVAQKRRNVRKQRRRGQSQDVLARQDLAIAQQAPVASRQAPGAAQQEAHAAAQEPVVAQQALGTAQQEPVVALQAPAATQRAPSNAPQDPPLVQQGPAAAQQERPPAQPAAQQERAASAAAIQAPAPAPSSAGPLPDEEQLMTAEAALALVDEFFAQAKACHTPGSALTRKAAKEAGALETWGPVHFAQRVQFSRATEEEKHGKTMKRKIPSYEKPSCSRLSAMSSMTPTAGFGLDEQCEHRAAPGSVLGNGQGSGQALARQQQAATGQALPQPFQAVTTAAPQRASIHANAANGLPPGGQLSNLSQYSAHVTATSTC